MTMRPGRFEVFHFKAGSQCPYFRVVEDDLRRVILWGSLDAQLPVIIGRVRHTGDLLMIHIYGESASLCHHGEQVRLIQPWGDRWRGALLQGYERGVIIFSVELVSPILIDIKAVEFVGAEDDAATVAFDSLHLHLNGEVAAVDGTGDTVVRIECIRCNGVVGPACEGTVGIYIPIVALAIVAQGVSKEQHPTVGVGVLDSSRGSSLCVSRGSGGGIDGGIDGSCG